MLPGLDRWPGIGLQLYHKSHPAGELGGLIEIHHGAFEFIAMFGEDKHVNGAGGQIHMFQRSVEKVHLIQITLLKFHTGKSTAAEKGTGERGTGKAYSRSRLWFQLAAEKRPCSKRPRRIRQF